MEVRRLPASRPGAEEGMRLAGGRGSEGRVVWLWQNAGEAAATTECPVSYITGESAAFLEDFYAQEALGKGTPIEEWPARRVEAFLLLKAEQRKAEAETDGRR